MGPRDTKYDPNSIPNLTNYNSTPIVTKLYTYSTHIQQDRILLDTLTSGISAKG